MKIFQKGFNFAQDGPGNRLVYHVEGCNMHCLWCSNPEGMHPRESDRDVTAMELIKEAVSCKKMFFSGGGVTFTGGETTLDYIGLKTVLCGLKENGINTAIETNGTSPHLKELLPYIDYLIMDFKHYDDDMLKKYTGVGTEQIKKNYEMVCKSGRQYHVRIPLINHFNTDNPNMFAQYFSSFSTENTVFEFLKYHEYGKEKWQEDYKITDGFVTDEIVRRFNEVFKEYGLKCVTT